MPCGRIIRAAVLTCALAIAFGPLYTESGYDWSRHSISELAAQHTANAWIMRTGLICLGLASIAAYWCRRPSLNVFFLLFGACIALSGLFSHKPFIDGRPYAEWLDRLHSALASLGGMSAVAAFFTLTIKSKTSAGRVVNASIALGFTGLSAAMFIWPDYQGIFQRMIFAAFIVWVLLVGTGSETTR
ncbi:MAG: DUF998 domain-containing protein [Gammaproteobacteria bacterium]|nr:DUF998 domain-containing protein [Gammaproteobacteria bacterium]